MRIDERGVKKMAAQLNHSDRSQSKFVHGVRTQFFNEKLHELVIIEENPTCLLSLQQEDRRKAFVRILHASPDIGNIDIYINNNRIFKNVSFMTTTDFIDLVAGDHLFEVFQSGKTNKPLLSKNMIVHHEEVTNFAAFSSVKELELFAFPHQPEVPSGESKIRFLHLATNTPLIDIAVKGRDVVFPNLSYEQITEYLGITPMTVDLEARIAGCKDVILPLPKLKFAANYAYTIAIVGSPHPLPLEVIILIDRDHSKNLLQ